MRNAGEVLTRQSCTSLRGKVAVVDGAERVTYDELLRRAHNCAAVLREMGVQPGDRVVIFLRRSVEAAAALFGTWFVGGVAVIANETLRTRQVHHIVDHSEASCVVSDTRQLLSVPTFAGRPVVNLDEMPQAKERFDPEPVAGRDLALLIYTSGSTGLPKGVMVSHDNLLAGTEIVSEYLGLGDRDVVLSVLPFSFDYGLNQLLTALFVGGTLVIQRSLFPRDVCQTLAREQITGLAGVPTLWLQLTGRHSPFLRTAYPSLRYITNSGGRLPETTVRLIREAHPHTQIYLMYGLTEAFRSTYLPPDQIDVRPSSMGKAIPRNEVLVINEQGGLCQPGEVGELVHRGPTVAMGYWHDPETTARVYRPNPLQQGSDPGGSFRDPRDGTFQQGSDPVGSSCDPLQQGSDPRTEVVVFSGDLVKTDAEGYLYYVGRRDKQIKSRGIRVSPEEVERCIYSSALISHVVSFGVPRDDGENDIVAVVIPHDPSRFCQETLEEFCRNEMPEYMSPRVIWSLDAFPLTSSGKPDRCLIQQMYVDHAHTTGIAPRAARTA
jgi:amino acid adenylation domain-containing protein